VVAFIVVALWVYESSKSIALAIAAALWGGPLLIFFVGILFAALSALVDAVWQRAQPDYAAFRAYETATADYARRLEAWKRTQIDWWSSMDGRRFEQEIGSHFRRRGYQVRVTGKPADEGVDLELLKEGRRITVQCKAHRKPIGPSAVRDLYGTLVHREDDEGWLISLSGFTRGAKQFAEGKPIRLKEIREIVEQMDE
jgi:hypothetical protein